MHTLTQWVRMSAFAAYERRIENEHPIAVNAHSDSCVDEPNDFVRLSAPLTVAVSLCVDLEYGCFICATIARAKEEEEEANIKKKTRTHTAGSYSNYIVKVVRLQWDFSH